MKCLVMVIWGQLWILGWFWVIGVDLLRLLQHQRLKIWAAKEIWSWGRKFGRGLGLTEPTKMEIQKWLEPCLMPVEEEVSECLRTSPHGTALPGLHYDTYLFICEYIYINKVCVHTFVRTYVRTYRQTDRHTDLQTYRPTDTHTDIRTYVLGTY